jgi:hypothetical protein
VRADEPISFGGTVTVTIKVETEKEIPDLGMSLSHDADVVVEGPEGWEKDSRNVSFFSGGTSWVTTVQAKSSIIFSRTLDLPPRGGRFYIIAGARTSNLEAIDTIRIYMTKEGGKVYLSGTAIPITPELLPVYTVTPGPSPTYVPTPTFPATPTDSVTSTSPAYPPPEAVGTPTSPPLENLSTSAYPPPEVGGAPTSPPLEDLGTPAYPPP